MHRIDTSTADPNANGAGKSGFVGGDLTANPPVAATKLDADWTNAIQEEIAELVEGLGGTLSKGTNDQLATLIKSGSFTTGTGAASGTNTDLENVIRGSWTRVGDVVTYSVDVLCSWDGSGTMTLDVTEPEGTVAGSSHTATVSFGPGDVSGGFPVLVDFSNGGIGVQFTNGGLNASDQFTVTLTGTYEL